MDMDLIKSLKPIGDGTFDKEPFEEYKKRAAPLLPNFPECALENWIYRHYADIDDYVFLGFEKMLFKCFFGCRSLRQLFLFYYATTYSRDSVNKCC